MPEKTSAAVRTRQLATYWRQILIALSVIMSSMAARSILALLTGCQELPRPSFSSDFTCRKVCGHHFRGFHPRFGLKSEVMTYGGMVWGLVELKKKGLASRYRA